MAIRRLAMGALVCFLHLFALFLFERISMFNKAYIPFRGYFSSPYAKWQGSLAELHSLKLAASTVGRFIKEREIDPAIFDFLYLGFTIHQYQGFYGGPWVSAMMGAGHIPGVNVAQACATSTSCLMSAAGGGSRGRSHLQRASHRLAQPFRTRRAGALGKLDDGQLQLRPQRR